MLLVNFVWIQHLGSVGDVISSRTYLYCCHTLSMNDILHSRFYFSASSNDISSAVFHLAIQ